jgi:hypothetical protein
MICVFDTLNNRVNVRVKIGKRSNDFLK